MFELTPLCDRPIPNWPFFNYLLQLRWFIKLPLGLALLLSVFFVLRWVIQHTLGKRWLSSLRANLLLFAFTATFPLILFAVADKGLVVFLPTDPGTAADAIVVLGRGSISESQRIDIPAQLWQDRRAPMIFLTGRGDAKGMIERLKTKGIPNRVLDGENCAVTTLENAVFTAAILQPQGIRRILLITDEPHMLRSLLVFRANGFKVIPRPVPIQPDWSFKDKAALTFREWIGLVSYALRGLFVGQRSPELNRPELVKIIQKAEQYGQQRRHIKS